MSNLRKAAEMALEALRNAEVVYMEQLNAMYALQEALAQPEWVGLTDEEAREIRLRVGSAADVYAKAIEVALKEKNT